MVGDLPDRRERLAPVSYLLVDRGLRTRTAPQVLPQTLKELELVAGGQVVDALKDILELDPLDRSTGHRVCSCDDCG